MEKEQLQGPPWPLPILSLEASAHPLSQQFCGKTVVPQSPTGPCRLANTRDSNVRGPSLNTNEPERLPASSEEFPPILRDHFLMMKMGRGQESH